MVLHRFNERESRPNKHINFITALPAPGIPQPYSEEDARQLLRALAAQVRPIMKNHGFEVNSFEEYEYNQVFAGRNWNAGEVVELVLRRPDGTFAPIPWLLSTLCHELAHIKHMNHGRDFQKLWSQLRVEVKALQGRGYFGDGYWSSGSRISDSVRVGGQGIEDLDLPEYICGGAQTRVRPKSLGRRRDVQRRVAGPSTRTGAQTEKKRKPGTRVQAKSAFKGEGLALNADISDEDKKAKGTGFRKKAGSKRAREERALAAEKRLKSLQGHALSTPSGETNDEDEDTEDNLDPLETDEDRMRMMKDTMKDGELSYSQQFMKDYLSLGDSKKDSLDKNEFSTLFDCIEISDDDDEDEPTPSSSKLLAVTVKKEPGVIAGENNNKSTSAGSSSSSGNLKGSSSKSFDFGKIVQDEITLRKREALGLDGARKLGTGKRPVDALYETKESPTTIQAPDSDLIKNSWACLVCTLENQPEHLACSACATPRGGNTYPF